MITTLPLPVCLQYPKVSDIKVPIALAHPWMAEDPNFRSRIQDELRYLTKLAHCCKDDQRLFIQHLEMR